MRSRIVGQFVTTRGVFEIGKPPYGSMSGFVCGDARRGLQIAHEHRISTLCCQFPNVSFAVHAGEHTTMGLNLRPHCGTLPRRNR